MKIVVLRFRRQLYSFDLVEGVMSNSDFSTKIRSELLAVKEQGYKTSVQKRAFTITLLGLGSVKGLMDGTDIVTIQLYQMFYLAPLVAIFFDFLEAEHKYSVRRMGRFLKSCSNDPMEREWEKFVDSNRDDMFRYGEIGFTTVVFIASIFLLYQTSHLLNSFAIPWFSTLLALYVLLNIREYQKFKKLSECPLPWEKHPVP
jgi:hypothetical protein